MRSVSPLCTSTSTGDSTKPLCAAASTEATMPVPQAKISAAEHINKLYPLGPNVTVNVDFMQMGIGGQDGCGHMPREDMKVPRGKYKYGYFIRVINSKMGMLKQVARQVHDA